MNAINELINAIQKEYYRIYSSNIMKIFYVFI